MSEHYVIRPSRRPQERAIVVGDDREEVDGITAGIILIDTRERPTGLVNAQGVEIYRVRPPVGFRGKDG